MTVPLSHEAQQQLLPQLSLPHPQPQPQLLPPKLPFPQQQHSRMMRRMIHRQEQLLFPLLKHMFCHLALRHCMRRRAKGGLAGEKKMGAEEIFFRRPGQIRRLWAGNGKMEVPYV